MTQNQLNSESENIVFGPVPSRRLGRSLGINNIPPKICTYACVYCQVGRTTKLQINRQEFYSVDSVTGIVQKNIDRLSSKNERVDYLCFVSDGEPTIDLNLGRHINSLKQFGIPVAVISNASLIDEEAVQNDLLPADWVSLKIDAVDEEIWRHINRPHGKIDLQKILDGILTFRRKFKGFLATETMLIQGINDSERTCRNISLFLAELRPDASYLALPTRPPAENTVQAAEPFALNRAYQLISRLVPDVEILSGYEGNSFSSTGDVRKDMLNITAVHPMREDAVATLLSKSGEDWHVVDELLQTKRLVQTYYDNHLFFLRRS
jgi:wyosine [tRNA(Phe)-imidazoG37] synthetase (radical SAM superfamily)